MIKDYVAWLEENCCDLRCIPYSNGIDHEVFWSVFSHYMQEPKLREIGFGRTPEEAIDDAYNRIKEVGWYGIKNKRL